MIPARRRKPPAAASAVDAASARHAPARTAAAQRVRIIGGLWKRTPLPVADVAGLRPTPDRVRETVFNWLPAPSPAAIAWTSSRAPGRCR